MSASFEEFKRVCKHQSAGNCGHKDSDGLKCSESVCPYAKEQTKIDRIMDNYMERKNRYSKCSCYMEEHERCRGTKELDLVDCGGNEFNCKLYANVREKAETNYIYRPQPTSEPSPLYQGYLQPDELLKAISNYKKKKVVIDEYDNDGINRPIWSSKCPTCDQLVGLRNENFCAHCGQHLDWGEEE